MSESLRPAGERAPLKIVVTAPWGERLGGAENFLWTFLRHVNRRDVDPTVVFLSAGGFERDVAALGIQTAVIESGRLREVASLLRTIRRLASLLRSKGPDLIINWSPKMHLYGAAAAVLARMSDRVTWWQHAVPNGRWLDRLATALPSRAVWCCSDAASRAQAAHWPHRPSVVIYPAIDRAPIAAPTDVAALRRRLGIPDERAVVGIVGRLQPWKGQDVFLRLVAAIRAQGYAVHGLVVGGNAYNLSPGFDDRLKALARDLDLQDCITFTGQVANAGPYLQIMDVSINASACEPFGLVILEAMAAGVPVVAYAQGGPAEILVSGESGMLVSPGDEEALTDAIAHLLDDPALRRRLRNAGRKRLEAFSAERMTSEMVHRFRELCSS
jgi:glycosyltransferase involved in cell wall biosynthesis